MINFFGTPGKIGYSPWFSRVFRLYLDEKKNQVRNGNYISVQMEGSTGPKRQASFQRRQVLKGDLKEEEKRAPPARRRATSRAQSLSQVPEWKVKAPHFQRGRALVETATV